MAHKNNIKVEKHEERYCVEPMISTLKISNCNCFSGIWHMIFTQTDMVWMVLLIMVDNVGVGARVWYGVERAEELSKGKVEYKIERERKREREWEGGITRCIHF